MVTFLLYSWTLYFSFSKFLFPEGFFFFFGSFAYSSSEGLDHMVDGLGCNLGSCDGKIEIPRLT